MALDLQQGRLDFANVQDSLNLRLIEVCQPDGFDQSVVNQPFHLTPGVFDSHVRGVEATAWFDCARALEEVEMNVRDS